MGTPTFCLPTLESLLENEFIELVGIVSMPDRPAGRGQQLQSPAVAQFAKDNGIRLFQTPNINKCEEFISYCNANSIDFFLVLSFAQFLNNKTLSIPKLGCFNIHTSLLPKYRGAAPIHYALKNGDQETGVSIQKMVKKMDAGDICTELKVPINSDDDINSLSQRLSLLCSDATKSFVHDLINNKLNYRSQDEENVSFAPEFGKEVGLLKFENSTAVEIFNQFRAFKIWPSLFFFIEGVRFKVIEMQLDQASSSGKPGDCHVNDNALKVSTSKGSILITSLQQEGKKAITAKDYKNLLKSKGLSLDFNIKDCDL